jgi:Ca2+-binding RTX toxin-like protein
LTDTTNVTGIGQNIDTAIFQGTMAEYEIEGLTTDGINYTGQIVTQAHDVNGDGFIFVRDKDTGAVGAVIQGLDANGAVINVQLPSSRGNLTDDRDLLKNIEQLQFADRNFLISGPNRQATGTVTIGDVTPFDGRVTPYVGQALVPTLSGFADLDGIPLDSNGMPVGLQWEWQTTEVGNNSGWNTITTANPYIVRSVDPGHILRAVAVFKDSNGVTERIFSAPTDNPTVAFSVNENSLTGTIVGLQIPFNVDYDSQSIGGNPPPDVDLATLFHTIDPLNSAGGRFKVVLNGVDFNGFPRYSLVVDQGGNVNLDYEASGPLSYQYPADNQYQVVVNTYDAPGGTLVAVRQFTIFLNDVVNEVAATPPTDIQWNGVTPGDGTAQLGNLANGLPASPLGADTVIANLTTVDADTSSGFVYGLAAGSSAGFTVSAAGVVTAVDAMASNASYTLNISSTDTTGGTRTEAFTLRTGTNSVLFGANGVDTITAANTTDNVIYGSGGNDALTGGAGNDSLFGQAGNDVLNGGIGNDILVGGGGTDTINGDAGNDTIRHTVGGGGSVGDGGGSVNGGADSDTLVILGTANDNTLNVVSVGAALTNFDGGTVTAVETITADLAGSTDTLSYSGNTAGNSVTVNLTTGAATGFTSIANIENVTGGAGQDTLTGNAGTNVLVGGAGADAISGGDGTDTITGGAGQDTLTGGAGKDVFVFGPVIADTGTDAATRDIITDFNAVIPATLANSDVINLSAIDANTGIGGGGAGGQAFTFLTTMGASFTAAGQIRYVQVDNVGTANDYTIIEGNVDGGLAADFSIQLSGLHVLGATDFVL